MTPRLLFIDIETRSGADLLKVGAWRYAQDPTTRILVVAWARDREPVRSWDITRGPLPPQGFLDALVDPAFTKIAHNAAFEIANLLEVWGIPFLPEQWKCSMTLGQTLALPGSLGKMGEAIGIAEDKAKHRTGRDLIRLFSIPRKPAKDEDQDEVRFLEPGEAPDKWAQFVRYCEQDVEAEREIWFRLIKWGPPAHEWDLWALDQKINAIGLPVDLDLVGNAIRVDQIHRARLMAKAREISGLQNPNSRDQILDWLRAQGVDSDSLTKADVTEILQKWDGSVEVAEFLEIRRELARSSVTKFEALARSVGTGGRLRGAFQFAGAGRTWRWAGRLFQPQNLPSGTIAVDAIPTARNAVVSGDPAWIEMLFGSVSETLSSLVRPAIAAPPGYRLVCADFSSIESVLVAWAAGEETILEVFRSGQDLYKAFAVDLFGVPYSQVTKAQRKIAKPPVLGCGYMLGAAGLVAYSENFGVEMTLAQAERAVDTFRAKYFRIPEFWRMLTDAVNVAMAGGVGEARMFRFHIEANGPDRWLFATLPSGRRLAYREPQIVKGRFGKPTLSYMGLDLAKKWTRIETHPGKITENLIQAIARDLLAEALVRIDRAGFEIVGHVHDEVITLVPEGSPLGLPQLIQTMTAPVEWCADAPIGAAGWEGSFYRKD